MNRMLIQTFLNLRFKILKYKAFILHIRNMISRVVMNFNPFSPIKDGLKIFLYKKNKRSMRTKTIFCYFWRARISYSTFEQNSCQRQYNQFWFNLFFATTNFFANINNNKNISYQACTHQNCIQKLKIHSWTR